MSQDGLFSYEEIRTTDLASVTVREASLALDFERMANSDVLCVDTVYTKLMNRDVNSENPVALTVVTDTEVIFEGQLFRIVAPEMTGFLNVMMHTRDGNVNRSLFHEAKFFGPGINKASEASRVTHMRKQAYKIVSGDQPLVRESRNHKGGIVFQMRNDCLVFDERADYADPSNKAILEELRQQAIEIRSTLAKDIGSTALAEQQAEKVKTDEFPFLRVPVANLDTQLWNFLIGYSDDFPVLEQQPSDQQQQLIKVISRRAFDADNQPADFQKRLGLFNTQLIELRQQS